MNSNTKNLEAELKWLEGLLLSFAEACADESEWTFKWEKHEAPELVSSGSSYGSFVNENDLSPEERIVLIMSIAPHLKGSVFVPLIMEKNKARLVKVRHANVLPSAETALLLLAGGDLTKRIKYSQFFDTGHIFYRKSVLDIGSVDEGASLFDGALKLNRSYKDLFIYNQFRKPRFSHEFPAHLLSTSLEWNDIVLNSSTMDKLEEIRSFHMYEKKMKEQLGLVKHIKPGYRCLFYGPSGTGKTLAATLLGKYLGKDVYRVDLSSVVSKYIGETAKNLNSLFNTAEDKDWILFFDEGDALFGKRADTSQADNKANYYANQDIGFLLQRIENYNGLVIVASNLRKNMDDAFSRRFQVIVFFDIPDVPNRLRLWRENVSPQLPYDSSVNLDLLAGRHNLPAASIVNVINRASLLTLQKQKAAIAMSDIDRCILDEQYK